MSTTLTEIGPRVFRLSTFFPDLLPGGFTFNQFLLDADEPLLFHTGMRVLFPSVVEAAARAVAPHRLRWVGFGHVEADECGAMNQWLAAAPGAQVVHGEIGCMVSLNDLADRPPRALAHGGRVDLGGRTVRLLATPHVPHGWESVVLFEEVTRTLMCGDGAADLFLCASEHEGFGMPLAQAMAAGVPVVALAPAATPEALGAGGVLVHRWGVAQVAELIDVLIADTTARERVRTCPDGVRRPIQRRRGASPVVGGRRLASRGSWL